ncbi:phage recombination protein Bet [Capnocytophaga canis]|uniref:phage recombination protein Bet n=1 Tax=Capnocytophaga canis TaxID=1848903 RepID=UPI0037D0E866
MEAQVNTSAVATKEKNPVVEYEVAGENIKLSYQIIRDYLTKGNGAVTDQDLMQFMSICKFNKLNPFLNEAYLIKFGSTPAQMIVSKEALMKRAEANEQYNGLEAGLILKRNEAVIEVEGNFYLKTDEILGAWAKVYRKDRLKPIVAKVNIEEYDKKQSSWNDKRATMIAKVAKVQALREAFPAQLGAMYTQEEQQNVIDISHREVVDKEVINQPDPAEMEQPSQVAPQQQKQINFEDL